MTTIEKDKTARVFYVRDEKKFPLATIVYKVDKSGAIAVGVSIWNPNDKFSKDLGRSIATGRMEVLANGQRDVPVGNYAFFVVPSYDRASHHEELNDILERMLTFCNFPVRVMRAIKKMMM